MKISGLIILAFVVSTIMGYSQEKTITIKKTIGIGKEIYHVKDKKNNLRQGPYLYQFGSNFQIKGQFLDNSKQGNWQYSYGDHFNISAYYDKGKKDSVWTYSSGNTLISEISYKNGRRHGNAIGYYSQGRRQSIIPYEDGKIDGIRKAFYENGKIKFEIEYKNDTIDGDLKYYNLDGKIILHIVYKKNNPFSIEIMELPDSIRYISGNLKNGTGSISIFSKKINTDSLFLISQQEYSNGLLAGKCTEYEYNGKVKFTGNYVNGFMIGQWLFYNPKDQNNYTSKVYSLKDKIRKDSTDLYSVVPSNLSVIFKHDMPKFYNNNANGFRTFISEYLEYPQTAERRGMTGKVYMQFDLDVIGELINIKPLNNIFDDLKMEAIRVLDTSPNWIPGFEDNIPCNVRYIFPITFTLR